MALINEELGQPWQEIYSELSPSPIAAGIVIIILRNSEFSRFYFGCSYLIQSSLYLFKFVAASLGQVYKGRLRENGDLVAVKVQRPFVLETVTIDLYIIRNLGLVLRKFPQVGF